LSPRHFLYFFPERHGHGSLRPIFFLGDVTTLGSMSCTGWVLVRRHSRSPWQARSRSSRPFRHKSPISTAPVQPRLSQIVPRSPAAAPSRLSMNPLGPAAAKPSADWDAHHASVLHRRHWPKLPDFPRRSEASRPSSNADAAPDPTEPKPCSGFLICLQFNQQTIAGKVAVRKAVLTGGLREADRLQRPE